MITLSVNCSRVSVRRGSHALQTRQGCASHSEVATVSAREKEGTR
jgi:hypothetical protein